MSVLKDVAGRLLRKAPPPEKPSLQQTGRISNPSSTENPQLPTAMHAYTVSARQDGGFDVLDGTVLAGGLSEEQGDGEHYTVWKANVRGVDASFNTLEETKAWLIPRPRR